MRYLVQFQPNFSEKIRDALSKLTGSGPLRVKKTIFDYHALEIPEPLIAIVQRIPGVVRVVVDRKIEAFVEPIPVIDKLKKFLSLAKNPFTFLSAFSFSINETKAHWPTGESRRMLGAHVAESEGVTGRGVKVAVLDTGHDHLSPQLLFKGGKSTLPGMPNSEDENGHGSWCVSCIAGKPRSSQWGEMKGVAPGVEIGIWKCLGYGLGMGSDSSVLEAMEQAAEWGANIVSMSLGSEECVGGCEICPLCRAVKKLTDQGIMVVVANGNSGLGSQGCPACSPSAISVGAIDKYRLIADFSSRGGWRPDKPDVMAPGVYTLSSTTGLIDAMQATDGIKAGAISGTSMATPHIAGLLALWAQYFGEKRGGGLTSRIAKDIMSQHGLPKSIDYGWGVPEFSWVKNYLR